MAGETVSIHLARDDVPAGADSCERVCNRRANLIVFLVDSPSKIALGKAAVDEVYDDCPDCLFVDLVLSPVEISTCSPFAAGPTILIRKATLQPERVCEKPKNLASGW